MMKAVIVNEPGGVDQLSIGERPIPEPTEDELLVQVKATALNRADIMQRMGHYPPPEGASQILGLEMAGVVVKVGRNCSGWHKGDRVFALLPGGGYAGYVTVPARMAMPIPGSMSFEEAAAVPEAFFTAYQALFWLGGLRSTERVLIHAGASGVGSAAIQLAKFAGAESIITAGSAKKLDFCRRLGAKVAINYRDGDFAASVLNATDGDGVNLVIDFIGAPYWNQNLNCLMQDGRMVMLAMMGGAKVDQLNLRTILFKRIRISGSTLRSRDLEYKCRLTNEFTRKILPAFADGRFQAQVDSTFALEDVAEAHQRMEANENMGKIVLTMDAE